MFDQEKEINLRIYLDLTNMNDFLTQWNFSEF